MTTQRGIYPAALADDLKAEAGQKWRPSNGTEGEIFAWVWCDKCEKDKDDACKIRTAVAAFVVEHEKYPSEWQYGKNGQPICTAFVEDKP